MAIKKLEGRTRVIVENITPCIDGGIFPAKRTVGEKVSVEADVLIDGHDEASAALLYRKKSEKKWHEVLMSPLVNDRWAASFSIESREEYCYTVKGWADAFKTWRHKLSKKWEAKQDIALDLQMGAKLLNEMAGKCPKGQAKKVKKWARRFEEKKNVSQAVDIALGNELDALMKQFGKREYVTTFPEEFFVVVDRKKALFSTWYEFFPRSWGKTPGEHGTFNDAKKILPEIARMGFDVVYFPPIHPIGITKRKGKNNSTQAELSDPGSPWAIGAKEGGHKSIHPQLGSVEDFRSFVKAADKAGIEVAMDIAFQCSPDHPYVEKNPEWFEWRPDGTVQFAENPPKKYEDIYPINFETDDWENLWKELKSVFLFWIKCGIKIFRVDNPHTKPFLFWDWVIREIREKHPDVIFLSEAFTRPKIMSRLAKGGFTQSYTYFTWRTTKYDFIQYMTELTQTQMREYFRPNFWTNTPDILPEHLQSGGRPCFMMRYVLAATLASNCGMYGPAFELCVSDAVSGKEEYLNSEKYEIKQWDWDKEGNLKDFIASVNKIRHENPALQTTWNVKFCNVNNDNLLCYAKATEDLSNVFLVVVNLDPHYTQSGWVDIPLYELGLEDGQPYIAHDLLSNEKYTWHGTHNYVELNPYILPAHIFKLSKA